MISNKKNFTSIWLIILPFFGIELVTFFYGALQGKNLYFLSSERSLFFSFGILLAIIIMFCRIAPKRFSIYLPDMFFITYIFLSFYALLLSFITNSIDIIFIKQIFMIVVSVFCYIYGKYYDPDYPLISGRGLFVCLFVVHLAVGLIGGSLAGGEVGFVALCIMVLMGGKFYRVLSLKNIVMIAIVLIFLLPTIDQVNRTVVAWMLLFLCSIYFCLIKKSKILIILGGYLFISAFLIFVVGIKDYQIVNTESKAINRINQLIYTVRTGDTSSSVSLSDRINEIDGVERKFRREASALNHLLGFGASARYEAYLSTGPVYDNHNVHVGLYWEYLKRGGVGVFLFFVINIAVLFLGIKNKDWHYQYAGTLRWFLFWYYLLSFVFWFTWANMYYTQPLVWLYMGMVFARTKGQKKHQAVSQDRLKHLEST